MPMEFARKKPFLSRFDYEATRLETGVSLSVVMREPGISRHRLGWLGQSDSAYL